MGKTDEKTASKDLPCKTAKAKPATKTAKAKPGAKPKSKPMSESDYLRERLKKAGIIIDPKKHTTVAALRKLAEQLC